MGFPGRSSKASRNDEWQRGISALHHKNLTPNLRRFVGCALGRGGSKEAGDFGLSLEVHTSKFILQLLHDEFVTFFRLLANVSSYIFLYAARLSNTCLFRSTAPCSGVLDARRRAISFGRIEDSLPVPAISANGLHPSDFCRMNDVEWFLSA